MYAWIWRKLPFGFWGKLDRLDRAGRGGRRAALVRGLPVGRRRCCRSTTCRSAQQPASRSGRTIRRVSPRRADDPVQHRLEPIPNPAPEQVTRVRILVIDNYDSFVFNLVQYLGPARRRVRGAAQRRDHRAPRSARFGAAGRPALARPGHAGARRHHAWTSSARTPGSCRSSASASATRRSARRSARR